MPPLKPIKSPCFNDSLYGFNGAIHASLIVFLGEAFDGDALLCGTGEEDIG